MQPNVVVVVGGTIWDTDKAPNISKVLRIQYENGAHIGGICGGTLALARAGMLDDIPHTSNDAGFLEQNAPKYNGAAHYISSASAVSSGRIITAPGTAPSSFTAAVFKAGGLAKRNGGAVQRNDGSRTRLASEPELIPYSGYSVGSLKRVTFALT